MNLKKYEIKARPDFWYNSYDGMKIGTNIEGHYLKKHHVFKSNLWVNSGMFRDQNIDDNELLSRYETACDPRLNNQQSLELIFKLNNLMKQGSSDV